MTQAADTNKFRSLSRQQLNAALFLVVKRKRKNKKIDSFKQITHAQKALHNSSEDSAMQSIYRIFPIEKINGSPLTVAGEIAQPEGDRLKKSLRAHTCRDLQPGPRLNGGGEPLAESAARFQRKIETAHKEALQHGEVRGSELRNARVGDEDCVLRLRRYKWSGSDGG
jgi:hypothetical protein